MSYNKFDIPLKIRGIMNRSELIELTEKVVKTVPGIRKDIRALSIQIKNNNENMDSLNVRKDKLRSKLTTIIKGISKLEEEDQRIICYKYFDGLTNKAIAIRIGVESGTIPRRIRINLLYIGRALFGMEHEFWKELDMFRD